MKRKYRISKPCLECGGSVPKMNEGGMNPMQMQAPAPVKESAVGMCTGTNFGGPDCPKGSQQYELALKFRKEQAAKKKKEAASVAEQGADIDTTTGKRNEAYKNYIANTATNVISEEEMLRAAMAPPPMHQMPDGTMMPGAQHMSRYGGVPEYFVGGIGPETEQQFNNQNEYSQARYDQQFGIDGPMKRIEPRPVVTDINTIIDAGQFKGTQAQNNLLDKDTDLLEDVGKLKNGVGKWARQNAGLALDLLPQFSPHQVDYDRELESSTYASENFTSNRDKNMGSIGFNDFGLAEDPTKMQGAAVEFSGGAPRDVSMSKYGGVPKYNLAGAVDYGYKANPFTNDMLEGRRDQQAGWDALGDLGSSWSGADLSDRMKWKTKVVDNDRKDGINTKQWAKGYKNIYKNNAMNDDQMKDMFNMFARYGGTSNYYVDGGPHGTQGFDDYEKWGNNSDVNAAYAPFWKSAWNDMWGIDNSMKRRRTDQANTPGFDPADVGEPRTGVTFQDMMNRVKTQANTNTNRTPEQEAEHQALIQLKIDERDASVAANTMERKRRLFDIARQQKANNSGANAIEADNNKSKSKSKSKSNASNGSTVAKKEEEKTDPTYRGNAERSEEDSKTNSGNGNYNPNARISYVDGVPFATDYTDTEIKYRNNWLRPNKKRVKSVKFTHGIRGNNNGPSGPGMQGDGQGAQSFDPNNPTPEQLAYIQQMMGVKTNDPINMLTDGTYDNMNTPDFGDGPVDMSPYDPNGWNRDELSYGYGEDQTPIIPGRGPQAAGEYTDNYTPLDQANIDASYMKQVPVPDVPTDRTDAEAQEAYDQREAEKKRALLLTPEDELNADLASQQYGGDAMYENGGPPSAWDQFMQGFKSAAPTRNDMNQVWEGMKYAAPTRNDMNQVWEGMKYAVPSVEGVGRDLKDAAVAAASQQYGGDTTYQEGWEGEMSEADLQEFINGGGQVEFI
jgi:hypothetical protein